MRRRWLIIGAITITLAGCAAAGTKVSEQQAESFKVGVSTYADVVGALGPPTSTTVSSDGTRMATYAYASARAQPQNFIPIIGPLTRGYDTQRSSAVFTFNANGVLTKTVSTEGAMGVGTNLAAGSNAASAPYQTPK